MRSSYFLELEQNLKKQILSGKLPEGESIPTESELIANFSLGRTTVRKALQKLVDSGMVYKVQGLGTFVAPRENWKQLPGQNIRILLIVPGFQGVIENEDFYDRTLISGVAGYSYMNHASLEIHKQEPSAKKIFNRYRNLKFNGIIWDCPREPYLQTIAQLRELGVPQITINRQVDGVGSSLFDYRKVFESVVNVFLATGRRRIAFLDIQPRTQEKVFFERQNFFSELMRQKVPEESRKSVFAIPLSKLSVGVIANIRKEYHDLEGVICNAPLLSGIKNTLSELFSDIPLVSFGESDSINLENSTDMNFITESREMTGRRAAEMIVQICRGNPVPENPVLIRGEFIVRNLCSGIKGEMAG